MQDKKEMQDKMEEREALIDEVIEREWEQFQYVQNEGGRASCQDDHETFVIMRKSQFMNWTQELLESYRQDLIEAEAAHWNLLTEKYARMMASTAPEAYAALKKELPPVSEQKQALCEAIISIQVSWMEDFSKQYPNLAGQARKIHTSEDTEWQTSYETYLRGELLTYSEDLLQAYGAWIVTLYRAGKNLAEQIMTNTVHFYQYSSLEAAEKQVQK